MFWFTNTLRAGVTAVRTLTVLPCPGRDAARFADALPWFPLVGALLGALLACLLAALTPLRWPLGAAALAVLANVLLTRAIHVDGLADMIDALGGGRTRERRLEIMKDSCNGAFGVTAVVLDLLLKTVALARLAETANVRAIIIVFVLARTAQAVIAASLPYARASGGTAAPFVAGATRRHALAAILIAAALIASLSHGNPLALAGTAIAAALVAGLSIFYRRNFGGVTGDLIGATNEIVETTLLLLAAATVHCSLFTITH